MKNNKGITLIEILIAITILGLVMASINQILNIGLKSWHRDEILVEAEQNIRLAAERIKSEAQLAFELDDKSNAQTLVLAYPTKVEISYKLSTASSTGPGELTGNSLERLYSRYSDAGRTVPILPQQDPQVIADYLNTLEFTYYTMGGGGELQPVSSPVNATYVEIHLASVLPDGEMVEYKTGIALRGKFLPRGEI